MGVIGRFATSIAGGIGLVLAMPVAAQFSDSFDFLRAVKERDGNKVMPYLDKPGAPVINTRDGTSGETALHVVVRRHDTAWIAFLLSRGARTDIKDNQGLTPLMVAAQTGDGEATRLLLASGANPNAVNGSGETPLIMATHNRDLAVGRQLIDAGASVRTTDTIAGKSAIDYATEDRRGAAMLKMLQDAKQTRGTVTVSGPVK